MRPSNIAITLAVALAAGFQGAGPAVAAEADGAVGLALAALVGQHAPSLGPLQKRALAKLLDGDLHAIASKNSQIAVQADKIVCRASNVDITARSCTLTFGARTVSLQGRAAHELAATIAEAGVPPDGAAGSVFEALSHLACTVDPAVIRQRAGGGARCTFDPGAS